jgi:hypothetical protein
MNCFAKFSTASFFLVTVTCVWCRAENAQPVRTVPTDEKIDRTMQESVYHACLERGLKSPDF